MQYFNEFYRVPVITQLEYSRNGRLCDLRFMCLLYADMNRHNWGISISRGFKVFPTHSVISSNALSYLFVHFCTTNLSDIANVYSTLRWKRLRHPTVSRWVVQWSQTTSSLIYLPSHIRTGSVAQCYSACQPLYLVFHFVWQIERHVINVLCVFSIWRRLICG